MAFGERRPAAARWRACLCLFSAALAFASAGCKTRDASSLANICGSVEESDLESSAKCYHQGVPEDRWRFLSKESQLESGTRQDFNLAARDKHEWDERVTRVLGVDQKDGGKVYGRVEVETHDRRNPEKACTLVHTSTWIREDGKWKRLRFAKTMSLLQGQFDNGDYSAALATAERWLSFDPFSVEALYMFAYALERGGRSANIARGKDDAVRAALSVNPVDSKALLMAVSLTPDPVVARSFFDKLPVGSCVTETAALNFAHNLPARERATFLEGIGLMSPGVYLAYLESKTEDRRTGGPDAFLNAEGDKVVRAFLDKQDASFAAAGAVTMGRAWAISHIHGSTDIARGWVEYAAARDPANPDVGNLLRLLAK